MNNIENIKLEEWLEELKPYQKNSIKILIAQYSEEKAAEIWITSNGPSNNVPFGGVSKNTAPFFERFKIEFKKFICGHPDYEANRIKLNTEKPVVKTLFLTVTSSAIGAEIGLSATLLIPAVAVLLGSVGKIGLNAYCAGINLNETSLPEDL